MTNIKLNPRKVSAVEELKKLLEKAKNVGVVDYKGMTVAQATDLRRAVKASGGQMKVTKNTLFKIATGKSDLPLTGLSAFIFSLTDEIAPLKAVAGKFPFKLGLAGDKVLTAPEVTALAATPAKEISVAKLMYLLQYHTSRFVRTLDAIAKKEVN